MRISCDRGCCETLTVERECDRLERKVRQTDVKTGADGRWDCLLSVGNGEGCEHADSDLEHSHVS